MEKRIFFSNLETSLLEEGFRIVSKDFSRPWGGFFVIDETQSNLFIQKYLGGIEEIKFNGNFKLSPKLLVVLPQKRLSWQYHNRRSEVWSVISGKAGLIRSFNNFEGDLEVLNKRDSVFLIQGERHRLVGLDDFAVVAEIWQHLDFDNPSDEDDIIRLQDDFGR